MSTETPPRRHRHTRSAANPSATTPSQNSQNPQNPHYLNLQAHARSKQSEVSLGGIENALQPSTPPRTPRRNNQNGTSNFTNSNTVENGSKQKSRNKNRPKNVITSPATGKKGGRTPPIAGPLSAGLPSTRPLNTPAAYAGGMFHASPAPSTLPIPSFYSKSVPDSPGLRGLRALKDNSPTDPLSTPPQEDVIAKRSQRDESPLDILFNADRAEKAARIRSASSYQPSANGPFPIPKGSPRTSQTPPATRSQTRSRPVDLKRNSSSGMFAMEELDGEDVDVSLGPAFSTPYSQRINAARSGSHNSPALISPSVATPKSQDSAAVKAFLFADLASLAPPVSQASPRGASVALQSQTHSPNPQLRPSATLKSSTRSSGLRQEVTPTRTPICTPERRVSYGQPNGQYQIPRDSSGISDYDRLFGTLKTLPTSASPPSVERRNDVQQAEDALRKILKLDALKVSDSPDPRLGNMPQSTNSVPQVVGGRPPQQMNGLHNGVVRS